MSISPSFISLIIPIKNIEKAYPGGLSKYREDNPHVFESKEPLYDEEIICDRIVMGPYLEERIKEWEELGLIGLFIENDLKIWKDFAIVDQFAGPTLFCPWLRLDYRGNIYYYDWYGTSSSKWNAGIFKDELEYALKIRNRELREILALKLLQNNLHIFKEDLFQLSPVDEKQVIIKTLDDLNADAKDISRKSDIKYKTEVIIKHDKIFDVLEEISETKSNPLYIYERYHPICNHPFALCDGELFDQTDYMRHLVKIFPDNRFTETYFSSAFIEEETPLPDYQKEKQENELTRLILIKNITVLRDDVTRGYALLEKPFKINVLSITHLIHPEKVASADDVSELAPFVRRIIKRRIRAILRLALSENFDTLVFSDFGCWLMRLPAKEIVCIFKEIFSQNKFDKQFRKIFFCITPQSIYDHFKELDTIEYFRKILNQS